MPAVDLYTHSNVSDLVNMFENETRFMDLDQHVRIAHAAWKEAFIQYGMHSVIVNGHGRAGYGERAADDRGTLVTNRGGLPRYRLVLSADVPASGLLPEGIESRRFEWDWAKPTVRDHTQAMEIDVKMLTRGSIRMKYYDVLQGAPVHGYGYEFVRMTEKIERRMRAETEFRPKLFTGRRFMTNMLLLGSMMRDTGLTYDQLFEAVATGLPFAALHPALTTGLMQPYLGRGYHAEYLRMLFPHPA